MSRHLGSERARIEKEERRRAFRENSKSPAFRKAYISDDSRGFFEYSEFRMRRLAPIATMVHGFTILFFLSWLFSNSKSVVSECHFIMGSGQLGEIQIPAANKLYTFDLVQTFPGNTTPLYSELEIEILDENYDHVYSVYKDLWQELHPDDEGVSRVYYDTKIKFEIELPKAGKYYLRAISYNNNYTSINGNVYSKFLGGIYFGLYAIVFGAFSVIFIAGSKRWGDPFTQLGALSKIKDFRRNKLFLTLMVTFVFIYIVSFITAITHYGYAASGDETVLPTIYYLKDNVIYFG